jgi:hypothetical protein
MHIVHAVFPEIEINPAIHMGMKESKQPTDPEQEE